MFYEFAARDGECPLCYILIRWVHEESCGHSVVESARIHPVGESRREEARKTFSGTLLLKLVLIVAGSRP